MGDPLPIMKHKQNFCLPCGAAMEIIEKIHPKRWPSHVGVELRLYVLTYRRQQFHSVKSIEMISSSEWRLGVPNLHHSLDVSRHPLDRADSVLRVVCTARGG